MNGLDHDRIRRATTAAGQGHLFALDDRLTASERDALYRRLDALDWDLIRDLGQLMTSSTKGAAAQLEPAGSIVKGASQESDARAAQRGEALLADGQVAVFLVAGGQGSRLGFDGPKGLYPATPVRGKNLFQLFAEKLRALGRRYGRTPPWYILTSESNDAATRAAFRDAKSWGLAPDGVSFLVQDMLPALDREGHLLLESPGKLFLSPNGHGGSLLALRRSGALDDLASRGVEQIFYFQVDNPLGHLADPVFMGYHDLAGAQMSSKVVPKRDAAEKVGVLGLVDGRYGVIEYSDLSDAELRRVDATGELAFRDGNIAVHALRRAFVEEITQGDFRLPYHLARKSISCVDPMSGKPRTVEGVKFETFVFDALGLSEKSVVLSVDRAQEFAPIKNADGQDSPATSRGAQSALFASWLARRGVEVPRGADGTPRHPIEISPLFADTLEAFLERDLPSIDPTRPIALD